MKIRQPMTACLLAVAVMGAAPARPGGAQARAPAVAPSKAADQSVTCAADGDERRALRSAPPGSKRISAHVLAVKYRSGVRQFVDKRPYRDELSGFHWHYCGYSPALKAHLVGMDDESLFSGKLRTWIESKRSQWPLLVTSIALKWLDEI